MKIALYKLKKELQDRQRNIKVCTAYNMKCIIEIKPTRI